MPDKPPPEVRVDEQLVRELLRTQAARIPEVMSLPLVEAAAGWDNAVWRLGGDLAVRLPRRAVAAPLVLHEQRVLPAVATRLATTGIAVPTPVVAGVPGSGYPWAWSVVPWIDGSAGLEVARGIRSSWARPLARALAALHAPAEPGFPVNPFRGVPLADRADAVASRLDSLRSRVAEQRAALDACERLWREGLAAARWNDAPVWIHGDLHPGNLVARGARLTGIIDFGDVTAGDPAYDLAVAWLAFDADGRAAFVAETDGGADAALWTRARAWAAAVVLMLLEHSDDNPSYLALGRECLAELVLS